MIKIVGLGPGAKEALTIGTVWELESCKNIFLRTEKHPTVDYLKEKNIEFDTYDNVYETMKSFDEVYLNIAKDLVEKHEELGDLVYAVPGHPLVAEKSVFNLIEECKKNNIDFTVPKIKYCTDNAAMIATAGYYAYKKGLRADMSLNSKAVDSLYEYVNSFKMEE